MKTQLRQNEVLIKSGAANMQKAIENIGGTLYLTNQRLVFEAHRFNVQTGALFEELANIQSAEKCWTRLLGIIPCFPNALAIYTKQGRTYRFTLFGRGAWSAALAAQSSRG